MPTFSSHYELTLKLISLRDKLAEAEDLILAMYDKRNLETLTKARDYLNTNRPDLMED